MSWGYKIALLYGSFVALMVGLVTLCVMQDDIHLVSKDYYKQEIAYQEVIDQTRNAAHLKEAIAIEQTTKEIIVDFPATLKGAKGSLLFFRPADARKDVTIDFHLRRQPQVIVEKKFDKGLWLVKMSFQQGEKKFYREQKLVIH
ncbi:MAG: FixH family protein [Thermonemataceae bacterium]